MLAEIALVTRDGSPKGNVSAEICAAKRLVSSAAGPILILPPEACASVILL